MLCTASWMRGSDFPTSDRKPATSSSGCPSPELPLPPPPPLDPEMTPSDEPLPPPPPDLTPLLEASLSAHSQAPKSPLFPKKSYMSYVSVRKPCRRHGYEGNYKRPDLSPPCRELDQQSCAPPQPHTSGTLCRSPDLSPEQPSAPGGPVGAEDMDPSRECESVTRTLPNQVWTQVQDQGGQTSSQSAGEVHKTSASKTDHSPSALDNQALNNINNNNQSVHNRNNNTNINCNMNNNNNGKGVTSTQGFMKTQLNRFNSHHLVKGVSGAEGKGRPHAEPRVQQDSYIVLPIDLDEPEKDVSAVANSKDQHQVSSSSAQDPKMRTRETSHGRPEVKAEAASDAARGSNRKWEATMSKDEELERLSRSYAERCGDQTLKNILVPGPDRAQLWDYMEGVFCREDLISRSKELSSRTARHKQQASSKDATSPNNTNISASSAHEKPLRDSATRGSVSSSTNSELPAHSAYFTTSEPKAKLLTRLSQTDLLNGQACASDSSDLGRKKEELISSITRKLTLLRSEQLGLQEEVAQNEKLGREVAWRVESAAKPNELQKYRLHVEETEKILNLLMSLSGRLARAQNALRALPQDADPDERLLLEAKKDKLSSQHEEARALKESLDKRGRQVEAFLRSYLTEDEFADYLHFVAMKAKLLVDARELDEKMRLGEEQLAALERRSSSSSASGRSSDTIRIASEWMGTRNTGSTSV